MDIQPEQVWDAMLDGAQLASEPLANWADLPRRNPAMTLITPAGPRTFPVIGVFYDYTSSQGTLLMAQSVYEEHWGDDRVGAVSLRLAPGTDPDTLARRMVVELQHEKWGAYRQLGIAPKFSRTPGQLRSHAPELGQHTAEILETLGYSREQAALLKQQGIV